MRVTIAASGQGRFKEELDFARDCQSSGYEPILLVLDPTPSGRLDELSAEYSRYGGSAFVGEEAWRHLEQDAGSTMGLFVDRYVRTPLREVASAEETLQPLTVALEGSNIAVTVGPVRFEVSRPSSDSPYLQEILQTTDEES